MLVKRNEYSRRLREEADRICMSSNEAFACSGSSQAPAMRSVDSAGEREVHASELTLALRNNPTVGETCFNRNDKMGSLASAYAHPPPHHESRQAALRRALRFEARSHKVLEGDLGNGSRPPVLDGAPFPVRSKMSKISLGSGPAADPRPRAASALSATRERDRCLAARARNPRRHNRGPSAIEWLAGAAAAHARA